jgi:hypothetical protein
VVINVWEEDVASFLRLKAKPENEDSIFTLDVANHVP